MNYAPESDIGGPDVYFYLRELNLEGQAAQLCCHCEWIPFFLPLIYNPENKSI